ncbi:MAG TPA: hypothetical protein PK147_04300, partial [Saprospiraceae bacterium]|nr:hypothetical protein [Saprospiraceae bacterium]
GMYDDASSGVDNDNNGELDGNIVRTTSFELMSDCMGGGGMPDEVDFGFNLTAVQRILMHQ